MCYHTKFGRSRLDTGNNVGASENTGALPLGVEVWLTVKKTFTKNRVIARVLSCQIWPFCIKTVSAGIPETGRAEAQKFQVGHGWPRWNTPFFTWVTKLHLSILQINVKNLASHVPSLKVTLGHLNWHGYIRCVWLLLTSVCYWRRYGVSITEKCIFTYTFVLRVTRYLFPSQWDCRNRLQSCRDSRGILKVPVIPIPIQLSRMHLKSPFWYLKLKKISGEGHRPLLRLRLPLWGWNTPPHTQPPWRSTRKI